MIPCRPSGRRSGRPLKCNHRPGRAMPKSFPKPTPERVRDILSQYGSDDRYFGADTAVRLVFEQWPQNLQYEEILVKVIVLNRLYSTNIYDVYTVAKRIWELGHRSASGGGRPF